MRAMHWYFLSFQDTDDEPLILFNFTFLMDLKSKKMAFECDAAYTQVTEAWSLVLKVVMYHKLEKYFRAV